MASGNKKYVERRHWLAQVLASDIGLTFAEKLIAVAFAELFSDPATGRGYPSQGTLSKAIGAKTQKTAQRALSKLVDARLLLRHGYSEHHTRIYQIPLERHSDADDDASEETPKSARSSSRSASNRRPPSSEEVEENRYKSWLHRMSQLSGANLMSESETSDHLRRLYEECSAQRLTEEESVAKVEKALTLR